MYKRQSYDSVTGTLTEYNTPSDNIHTALSGSKTATYTHSLRGLILSETDVYGNRTRHHYDAVGRLSESSSDKVNRTLIYDSAQRLQEEHVTSKNRNTAMQITYAYDDRDREIQRTFKVDKSTLSFYQTYGNDGRLDKIDIVRDGETLRHETFNYDINKRLQWYSCSGPQIPKDVQNKPLTGQDFHYNALGGIAKYNSYSSVDDVKHCLLYTSPSPRDCS